MSFGPELNQRPMDTNYIILQSTALPTELPKVTRNSFVESVVMFDWACSRINDKLLLKLRLLTKPVFDTAGSLKNFLFVVG